MKRSVGLLVALLLVAALGVAASFGVRAMQVRIELAGGDFGHAYLGMSDVKPGEAWVIRGITLCLNRPGEVAIDRVVARDSAMVVEAFAVQDNPLWEDGDTYGDGYGMDHRGTLEDNGFRATDHMVRHECQPPVATEEEATGKGQELLIQVRMPAGADVGHLDGYDVIADGRTTHIPLEITLCAGNVSTDPACARP